MPRDTLTVIDNRTGKQYEIVITDRTICAADLEQIRVLADAEGLVSYDPAVRNTATCRSAITFLDGNAGVLRYRGYRIEDLARHSTFLEVAYLITHSDLPTQREFADWQREIEKNYLIHENTIHFMEGFRYDAPPMGILVSTVAALSTFFSDATEIDTPAVRHRQVVRLLGQVPTLAAFAHRRCMGMPYAYPQEGLSYTGNFLNMMFRMTELRYEPEPVLDRALDVLFILHADHEQACSTTTMRCVGSAKTDPYSSAAAATAALYGRFHEEAYDAVPAMLRAIGKPERVSAFIETVKAERSEPPGFGHRVYKTLDPRAAILREEAEKVFAVTGRPDIFDVALELDRQTERDPYFQDNRLYPFIDYYETIIYHAMGFPTDMFPVLFAIPRFVGWLAQWEEMLSDPAHRTYRPTQIYTGVGERAYVAIDRR